MFLKVKEIQKKPSGSYREEIKTKVPKERESQRQGGKMYEGLDSACRSKSTGSYLRFATNIITLDKSLNQCTATKRSVNRSSIPHSIFNFPYGTLQTYPKRESIVYIMKSHSKAIKTLSILFHLLPHTLPDHMSFHLQIFYCHEDIL